MYKIFLETYKPNYRIVALKKLYTLKLNDKIVPQNFQLKTKMIYRTEMKIYVRLKVLIFHYLTDVFLKLFHHSNNPYLEMKNILL